MVGVYYSPSRIRWKPTEWSRHFFPIKTRQVAEPASVHHEVLPMDELMSSESSRDSLGIGKCLSVFLCKKKFLKPLCAAERHTGFGREKKLDRTHFFSLPKPVCLTIFFSPPRITVLRSFFTKKNRQTLTNSQTVRATLG